jgi:gliding motility-associated-like protein
MKTFTLLVSTVLLMFASISLNAQVLAPGQPEQNPCSPLLLCSSGYTTGGAYTGVSPIADSLPHSCIPGFTAAVFWQVSISVSGTFQFTLTPTNACDDYDWAVYKVTKPNLPCPYDLSSDSVVRCDANDIYNSPGGQTGLGPSGPLGVYSQGAGAGPAFLVPINVLAGESYLVVINNAGTYGCPPGTPDAPVNISFTGSTALFSDSLHPAMSYITPSCSQNEQVQVHMNKPIKCSSIDANGSEFLIDGLPTASSAGIGCGVNITTQDINVIFTAPLAGGNHTLSIVVGGDGNNLLDECDSSVIEPDTLQFYVNPYVPVSYTGIAFPACSEIRMGLNDRVNCDSIAINGSDYIVTGPQAVKVVAAYGIGCDSLHFTDSIVLLLSSPIIGDGVYTVRAQNGTDGSTQVDSCGTHQQVGDSIKFTINSYDGQVSVLPHLDTLCHTGYLQLFSTNKVTPPDSPLVCGTAGPVCPGVNTYFASGKNVTSNVNSVFYGYGQSRLQFLYTAQELKNMGMKPGTIQRLAFNVITNSTSSIIFNNFTVKLGCTQSAEIDQSFIPGLQIVYNTASYTSVPGWNNFPLTTPFNWDGTTNLVVEVCDNNTGSSFTASSILSSITSFPSVYHVYTYSTPGTTDGCAVTAGTGVNTVNNYTTRPKTRFNMCPAPGGDTSLVVTQWSPSSFISNAFDPNPRIFALNTTLYTATAFDRNGCPHRDTAHIIVSYRYPSLLPKDTAICVGDTIHLYANGGNTYAWYTSTRDTVNCGTCGHTYSLPDTTTIFNAIITDIYNCSDTLSSFVKVNQSPLVVASPRDTSVLYGSSIRLMATGANTYTWLPPYPLDHSDMSSPVATITAPVHFTVIGIDTNGCHSFDTSFIGVIYRNPIFVPSAFTPNNDGKNDVFRVAGLTFQKVVEFRVFNRWGQEIYDGEGSNRGWDGTFGGTPVDIGSYNYLIRVVSPDGFLQVFKGSVTLIR